MYSWANPGSNVFCDWLFHEISDVSLKTAANVFSFFNVAMILREKLCQLWKLNWFLNFITEVLMCSYYEGKVSMKANTQRFQKMNTIPKTTNSYNNNSTFVSHLFLGGSKIVYTPIQGTNREKYFNNIIYKEKMPNPVGNKPLSVRFFYHGPRLFHLSTDKSTGPIRQKWTSKWLL